MVVSDSVGFTLFVVSSRATLGDLGSPDRHAYLSIWQWIEVKSSMERMVVALCEIYAIIVPIRVVTVILEQ